MTQLLPRCVSAVCKQLSCRLAGIFPITALSNCKKMKGGEGETTLHTCVLQLFCCLWLSFPSRLSEVSLAKYFSSLLSPLGLHYSSFPFNLLHKHASSLFQRVRAVPQKVHISSIHQPGLDLPDQGKPKDTSDPPCLLFQDAAWSAVWNTVAAAQLLQPPCICLQVSVPGCVLVSKGATYGAEEKRQKLSTSQACLAL